jgi:cytoskeletal protein CcmA (bactofilin family)
VPIIVKSRSNQSGDLQQWKDHDEENLVRIDKDGHIFSQKLTTEDSVVIGGNLTVNGTTTTIDSIIAIIKDPVLLLGGENAPTEYDAKDRGIEFRWHDGQEAQIGFFGFDHSTKRFTFIPYAENDGEIFAGAIGGLDADHIQFALDPSSLNEEARFVWNPTEGTMNLGLKGQEVVLRLGQDTVIHVHNSEVSALVAGDIVAVSGSNNGRISVVKALASSDFESQMILGIVSEGIDANEEGFVTVKGALSNVNTYVDDESEGKEIWLSDSNAGKWTTTKPNPPSRSIRLGYISKEDSTEGSILVDVSLNAGSLQSLHDVDITTPIDDWDILYYDELTDTWKNTDISTVVNSIDEINAQSIVVSGDLTVETDAYIDGNLDVDGDITSSSETFNLLNANVTTLNLGGDATNIQIGSSTGTTNVNNDLDVDGDLNIDGGDLTVSTSTFNLADNTATTINFGGDATLIEIGSDSGTTNINNDLDVDGDINVDGGDFTTSQSTFNLLNNTAQTINFGGAATTIEIGASTGTTNVNNNLDVDLDLNVDGGDITTSATTFNIVNQNATSVNLAGEATSVVIGSQNGTTNVRNSLDVDGDLNIDGGDLTASTSNFNLLNVAVTTLNLAGAATTISIGADTGNTTINNNLIVDDNLTINGVTTTFNPPTESPPFTLGDNALNQKVIGLNADLLDNQDGTWYQARQNHTGTQLAATISDFTDAAQKVTEPMLVHSQHSNITATYNPVSKRIILSSFGGGGGGGADFSLTYWMGV